MVSRSLGTNALVHLRSAWALIPCCNKRPPGSRSRRKSQEPSQPHNLWCTDPSRALHHLQSGSKL
eukprot:5776904-Pyramimonas_sp.AAC.1